MNDTLTGSNTELHRQQNHGNQDFQRTVRMYKLQTNMNLVEKHTVEVSQKINKAENK